MTEPIINGLFLLSATVVGSLITIFSTRTQAKISELKDENSKMKNRLKKALQQIEAYHQLEDTYAQELSFNSFPRLAWECILHSEYTNSFPTPNNHAYAFRRKASEREK